MNTQELNNKKISSIFSTILNSLSDKEKNVIERRVWLFSQKETLQSIWNSFFPNITRERVRQIEDSWIKKIWRIIKASLLANIQETAKNFIEIHWWIISKEKLNNILIKELNLEKNINASILEIIVQSTDWIIKSKQRFGCKIYFILDKINKKNIDFVHNEALKILKKKKDVLVKTVLYEIIISNIQQKAKVSIIFIDSVLELFEDLVFWEENLIGLEKWKILNPKTLKDKSIYVMKKIKIPMHFVDISNKITELLGDSIKVNTIHNELIRNNEFVLIGRWIYALKEWGFVPWTVLDVIVWVLSKKWEPMTTENIIKSVLKTRKVRETTIYMNLQNKKVIKRVWRNYYELKK